MNLNCTFFSSNLVNCVDSRCEHSFSVSNDGNNCNKTASRDFSKMRQFSVKLAGKFALEVIFWMDVLALEHLYQKQIQNCLKKITSNLTSNKEIIHLKVAMRTRISFLKKYQLKWKSLFSNIPMFVIPLYSIVFDKLDGIITMASVLHDLGGNLTRFESSTITGKGWSAKQPWNFFPHIINYPIIVLLILRKWTNDWTILATT